MKTCRIAVLTLALLLPEAGGAVAQNLPCAVEGARVAERAGVARTPVKKRFVGERFVRTELFFGTATPDGEVSEEQFKEFLDQCVTPRFPDGLTIIKALGQFRGANGVAVEERAVVLVLLYPDEARRESSTRIEVIREAYKEIFRQESVLRTDRCCEQVGF